MCLWCNVLKDQVRARDSSPYVISSNVICSDYYSQCVQGSGSSNPGNGNGGGNTGGGNTGGGSGAAGALHDKFKAKGKQYFGTEIDHYHLSNSPLMTIAKNSFGQVTHENSMKWDAIERM